MSRWVVDTSPLILLAKIDRLSLLRAGATEIYIPTAVADEAAQQVQSATKEWLTIQPIQNQAQLQHHLHTLDSGEAEAITLAQELSADYVLLDDLDARRTCRAIGQKNIGTLGVLLAAKQRGLIPSLHTEIEKLRLAGLWASDALVDAVLQAAQEKQPD